MPSKRFLEIQKLYTTYGATSLTNSDITFVLKRLERAELMLEKISRLGYDDTNDMLKNIKKFINEG